MKNFPKRLDSKTSCLRITVPENLDLALEGLIRKVLREQPKTDDIYSFAANYFETLLKIRERTGEKFTAAQLCPFHNDEDAHEMIKIAGTFSKPVSGKLAKKNDESQSSKSTKGKKREEGKTQGRKYAGKGKSKESTKEKKPVEQNKQVTPDLIKKLPMRTKKETEREDEKETKSEGSEKSETKTEEDEEFLTSDPIKELVEKELMMEANENKTDGREKTETVENTQEKQKPSDNITNEIIAKDNEEGEESLQEEKPQAMIEDEREQTEDGKTVGTKESENENPTTDLDKTNEGTFEEAKKETKDVLEQNEGTNKGISADKTEEENKQATNDREEESKETNKTAPTDKIQHEKEIMKDVEDENKETTKTTEVDEIQKENKQSTKDDEEKEATEKITAENIKEEKATTKDMLEAYEQTNKKIITDMIIAEIKQNAKDLEKKNKEIKKTTTADNIQENKQSTTALTEIKTANQENSEEAENSADKTRNLTETVGQPPPDFKPDDKKEETDKKPTQKDMSQMMERFPTTESIKRVVDINPTEKLPQILEDVTEKGTAQPLPPPPPPLPSFLEEQDLIKVENTPNPEKTNSTEFDNCQLPTDNKTPNETEIITKSEEITSNDSEQAEDDITNTDKEQMGDAGEPSTKNTATGNTAGEAETKNDLIERETKASHEQTSDNSGKDLTSEELLKANEEQMTKQDFKPRDAEKPDDNTAEDTTFTSLEETKTDENIGDTNIIPTTGHNTEPNETLVEEDKPEITKILSEPKDKRNLPDEKTNQNEINKLSENLESKDPETENANQIQANEGKETPNVSQEPPTGLTTKNIYQEVTEDEPCSVVDIQHIPEETKTNEEEETKTDENAEAEELCRVVHVQHIPKETKTNKEEEVKTAENIEVEELCGVVDVQHIPQKEETDEERSGKELSETREDKTTEEPLAMVDTQNLPKEDKTDGETINEKHNTEHSEDKTEPKQELSEAKEGKTESKEDLIGTEEDKTEPKQELTEAEEGKTESKEDLIGTEEDKAEPKQELSEAEEGKTDSKEELAVTEDKTKSKEDLIGADEDKTEPKQELTEAEEGKTESKEDLIGTEEDKTESKEDLIGTEEDKTESKEDLIGTEEGKTESKEDLIVTEEGKTDSKEELAVTEDKTESKGELGVTEEHKTESNPELSATNEDKKNYEVEYIEHKIEATEPAVIMNTQHIITVEEFENSTKTPEPTGEFQIKEIQTHIYDTLRVPETITKEYIVHSIATPSSLLGIPDVHDTHERILDENMNSPTAFAESLPSLPVEQTTDFPDVPFKDTPLSSGRQDSDDLLLTPTSGYSLNVSELSLQTVSELFVDSEKRYSSLEKEEIRYVTPETAGENKQEVVEVIEKTATGSVLGAVPVPPREVEEITREANAQISEIAKEKKGEEESDKPEEGSSEGSDSNNGRSEEADVPIISVEVKTVIETQILDDEDEEEGRPEVEVNIQATIDVQDDSVPSQPDVEEAEKEVSDGTSQEKTDLTSSPEELPKSLDDDRQESRSTEQTGRESSSGETESTSSAATEIKRVDSAKTVRGLLSTKSLDLGKRNPLVKTRSLSTFRHGVTDFEVWNTIEKELEDAAIKIQSKFRGYKTRKKLQRENAVQITTEESSMSTTPVETEIGREEGQQSTGEFHDSIVLSEHPR